MRIELIDYGFENPSYFNGHCSDGSDYCCYGVGETPKDAMEDCLECLAQSLPDSVDIDTIEQDSDVQTALQTTSPSVTSYLESEGMDESEIDQAEIYYHIGIRVWIDD